MTDHVIDLKGLQEVLSEKIDFPEGELHEMCTIEGVIILMWNFKNFISCKKAGRHDFIHVKTDERLYQFERPCQNASLSLPFFVLNDKHSVVFHDEDKQIIKESYTYPFTSEGERKNALYRSLQTHNYNVEKVDATKTTHHFCEFSGGGDIYITKDLSSIVVVTPLSNNLPQTVSAPKESMESPNMSLNKLQYQLWANMILLVIEKFMQSLRFNTKENLLQLKRLVGYGMACSGDGVIGAFKLEIDLIGNQNCTRFVTKVKLGPRDRLKAASLMDYIFEYFDKIQ